MKGYSLEGAHGGAGWHAGAGVMFLPCLDAPRAGGPCPPREGAVHEARKRRARIPGRKK
ncbi:hypothetical protein D187_001481 [Cystobacter fuscus DSM 2262]|uniref:Uncharacterized protein n=1 Tax=Cystobacter fuscus (strain ATCC 25194 / DSM 2262 / NBRC 100088 / M29) TaxID=1242864 RepID=S9P8Q3_CYSF2|nr:hypothetical protein D187_001481 [Cystobacter fuscus DSM 2262]